MRIAYHPTAVTLSADALAAWLAAAITNIAAPPAPGIVIALTNPDYPASFETGVMADDRTTQGGVSYSRILYTGRAGALNFSNVPHAEIAAWRAWYAATHGFRLPSVIELDAAYAAVAPANAFPLSLARPERWAGRIELREALGWI